MPRFEKAMRWITQGSPSNPPAGQIASWFSNDTVPRLKTRNSAGAEKYIPYELYFNVRDYGAVGNGVADDASAIQAAINAANTAGGGTVVIPAGLYKIMSELEITGNYINIRCDYRATIQRGSNSMQYMIKNFNPSYAPTGYGGRSHLRIEGGVWDANGINFTTSCTAIVFAHAAYVRVIDAMVLNVPDWHAFEFNSCFDVAIENCISAGLNVVTAGRDMSEAIQLDLATGSGALPGIGAGAYDNTPCANVLVKGCQAVGFGTLGSYGKIVGSHNAVNGVPQQNIRIIGCYGESLNDYAFAAYNWQGVVISDCQVVNSNGGVLIEIPASMTTDIERFAISNNQFFNMGVQNNGTSVEASVMETRLSGTGVIRSASFTNNQIKTFANVNGLKIASTSDVVVQGNSIRNGTNGSSVGLLVDDSAFGLFTANKFDSLASAAMKFQNSSSDEAVSGNCINSACDGVVIDSARVALSGNMIRITSLSKRAIYVTSNGLGSAIVGNILYNSAAGTATAPGIRVDTAMIITVQANMIVGQGTAEGAAGTISRGGAFTPPMATTIAATPENLNNYAG